MSALPGYSQKRAYQPVRTRIREGRIERVKYCPGCGIDKLVSEGPESEFGIQHRSSRTSFKPYCKKCTQARHKARMKSDPEYAARIRANTRKGQQKYLAKPGKREIARAASRNWQRNMRATEQGRQYLNESARLQYALRREREGKPVKHRTTVIDGTMPRLPMEPFRAYLLAYKEAAGIGGADSLARELGLNKRRVSSVLAGEYKNVSLDAVDTALINAKWSVYIEGKLIITIDDLYGEGTGGKELP